MTGRPRFAALARPRLVLLAALGVSVALQLLVISSGRIHWNSDQAVVGIMARDIQTTGVHPAFYYGSDYAGTLEPHWVAAVFAVLGPSVAAYRVAMGALVLALISVVYATARLRFGDGAARLAALYLAVPPAYFFYKGLTSDGAYTSLALISCCCVYAALRLQAALDRGRGVLPWLAALGFFAGVGWWVDPLIGCVCLPIAIWFLWLRPAVIGPLIHFPVFLGAFALGSLPWWIENVRSGWRSLAAPELALVGASQTLEQLGSLLTIGLPILVGSHPVRMRTSSFPGEALLATVFYGLLIAAAAGLPWERRASLRRLVPEGETARTILLVLLVLVVAPAAVVRSSRADLAEPRYLFLLYAALPIAFGFAVAWLWPRGRASRVGAVFLVVFAAAAAVRGLTAPHEAALNETNTGSLSTLIAELDRRGLHSVYASYWVAYRLDFETADRIAATPFGEWRQTRVERYRERAASDPRPAFVLYGAEAENMTRYLNATGDRYQSFTLGSFRVFFELPEPTLKEVREAGTIPEAVPQRRAA